MRYIVACILSAAIGWAMCLGFDSRQNVVNPRLIYYPPDIGNGDILIAEVGQDGVIWLDYRTSDTDEDWCVIDNPMCLDPNSGCHGTKIWFSIVHLEVYIENIDQSLVDFEDANHLIQFLGEYLRTAGEYTSQQPKPMKPMKDWRVEQM